jgi:hypothetical protein
LADGSWPSLDAQAPDHNYALSTQKVLRLLPTEWHNDVWMLLCDQLESARQFGRNAPGQPVVEELAQCAVRTTRWLEEELEYGFPSRVSEISGLHAAAGAEVHDLDVLAIDELTRFANSSAGRETGPESLPRARSRPKWLLRLASALRDERGDLRFPREADVDTQELNVLTERLHRPREAQRD